MPITDMLLAEDLFEQLLAGKKNATIRNGYRDVRPGPFTFKCVGNEERTVEVDVFQVIHSRLEDVSSAMLMAEGFASTEEALVTLRRFYPTMELGDEVTVVLFMFISLA